MVPVFVRHDEVVTPYTNGFFRDKNPRVQNRVVQDWCALDPSEHFAVSFNRKSV